MKTIVIVNQKGGVAKTTSTHNIGAALAQRGKRVLLIDLDPQANLTICLGLEPLRIQNGIVQVLRKNDAMPIKDCITHLSDNMDVVTSVIDLASIEMEMFLRPSREKILERALAPVADEYDYALIDCPSQLSILTLNALSCANGIIIPVKTDYLAYRGLTLLQDTIADVQELLNPQLHLIGVIATMFEKSVKDDNDVRALLNEEVPVLATVKKAVATRKGIYEGKSIVEMLPKSEVAMAYDRVAEQIIEKEERV